MWIRLCNRFWAGQVLRACIAFSLDIVQMVHDVYQYVGNAWVPPLPAVERGSIVIEPVSLTVP